MANENKNLRICEKGHKYYKTTDCPTCPVCEQERKPAAGFLSTLGAPARRALENNGIKTVKQLSEFTKAEILKFHGMGPASIPKLLEALAAEGLSFKTKGK
ncbi:MAG: RNA polymerase alpha subunit C-terminal domain-containing protein [Mucilaginibacter sp.]